MTSLAETLPTTQLALPVADDPSLSVAFNPVSADGLMGVNPANSFVFRAPLRTYSAEEAPTYLASRLSFDQTMPWGLPCGCTNTVVEPRSAYVTVKTETSPWDSPISFGSDPSCVVYEAFSQQVRRALTRRTLLSESRSPEVGVALVNAPPPSLQQLLSEVVEKSQLSLDSVAPLVGVARRTVYNWASGSTTKARVSVVERLGHLHTAISRIAESRDPWFVRGWVTDHEAAITRYLSDRQWGRLGNLIDEANAPARQVSAASNIVEEVKSEEIQGVTHQAFLASPPAVADRRSAWHPKEVTGLGDHEDVD
jgi:hypothetical protein